MSRFFKGIALTAALVLASCSGGGGAKNPSPEPTNPVWAVSSFTASDTESFVGSVVVINATVTKDGAAAPDGTTVEISVEGPTGASYGLGSYGVYTVNLATSNGGKVVTALGTDTAGTYSLRAKVVNATKNLAVLFKDHAPSDTLKILPPLLPDKGAYAGGEQVVINAEAVIAPVEVDFTVNGVAYPAEVVSVQESDPLSSTGMITLRTPAVAVSDYTVAAKATITVRSGVDTAGLQTATAPDAFTYLAEQALEVYQPFQPLSGSYDGGTQVLIRGRGIKGPAVVRFILGDNEFVGLNTSVTESNPATADGLISVETPFIPANLRPKDDTNSFVIAQPVDVSVTVAANTADTQTAVVPSAFTFTPDSSAVGGTSYPTPTIYLINPNHGSPTGGEQITIIGNNFRGVQYDAGGNVIDTPVAVDSVVFNFDGRDLEGIVQTVSADGTQIIVLTPVFSTVPITTQKLVDVTVNNLGGDSNTATLNDGFVVIPDQPTPEITGIAPTSGPIDGGTQVTIFGHGFQTPAQVTFGGLEAVNVQVTDDQTVADQDQIICVTPDYSQQGEEPPAAVDVEVRNVLSGKTSNNLTYTYGDNLYLSSNSPVEGGPGDSVVIYGSGFEAPLHVDFIPGGTTKLLAENIRLDVLSVSGTEILARFPIDSPVACENVTGSFRITLIESSDVIEGGAFTYLGSTPHIYSVEPIFVQETSGGDGVTPTDITIHGEFFNTDLIVEIDGYRIPNGDIDVVDSTQINVSNIPAPNVFDIKWDQTSCLTPGGLTGIRRTSTPVSVTVSNLPGECSTTLPGGLVYEPEQPVECIVSPVMTVTTPTFPATEAGNCSAPQPLVIFNGGGGSLDITSMTLQGPFQYAAAPVLPLTVAPFTSDSSVSIQYCPVTDDGLLQPGQLVIVSNDPGSPTTVALQGQETFPVIQAADLTMSCAAGSTCTDTITVSNTGSADLTWTEGLVGDAELTVSASDGTAAAGGSGTITIQMDATGAAAGDSFTATVTITATEPDAQNSPATVQVTGNVS